MKSLVSLVLVLPALLACFAALVVMILIYGPIWLAQIVTDFLGEHCEDFE